MRLVMVASWALLVLVVPGCVPDVGGGEGNAANDKSFGRLSVVHCTAEERELITRAWELGKEAVQTAAFAEKVAEATYWPCDADPGVSAVSGRIDRSGLDFARLADQAVELARHPSDIEVECINNDDVWGTADHGKPDLEGPERVNVSRALLRTALSRGPCGTGSHCGAYQDCIENVCVEFSPGWTTATVASVIWHEVMHQRGYLHTEDWYSVTECGYAPSDGYVVGYGMPYIVGAAVSQVLAAPCTPKDPCENGYRDEDCGRPYRRAPLEETEPLAVCDEAVSRGGTATIEALHLGLAQDEAGHWRSLRGNFSYTRADHGPDRAVEAYGQAAFELRAFARDSATGRFVGRGYWHGRGQEDGARRDGPVCRRWGSNVTLREARIRSIPDCGGGDEPCHRLCLSDEVGGCSSVCLGDDCDGGPRPEFLRDMRCHVDADVLARLQHALEP